MIKQELTLTDNSAAGFVGPVDVLRYPGFNPDPEDAHGMAFGAVPPMSRVLDVGCAGGALASALTNLKGCTVTGVEPNLERAAAARELGVNVIEGFLGPEVMKELPLHDVVILLDVLEHCEDPLSLLLLTKKLVAPGGRIIISVPNIAHWTVRLNLLLGRFDYAEAGIMDATHLRWFTRRTVLEMLARAGLRPTLFDVTRGLWMSVYWRRPLRWIGARPRRSLLNAACKLGPGLFGVQHFVVSEID